jgi:hypothetical protein
MRPEVERIEQPIPFVDEGDYYDDADERAARSFIWPVLFMLVLVFIVALIYAMARG